MTKSLLLVKFFLFILLVTALEAEESPYRLKYGDRLDVSVYGEDNSKREILIGPDGSTNYLFINGVPAAGRTLAELRQDLTERLKNFYRYPLLNMTTKYFAPEYYSVIGQVNTPGSYPIYSDTTILSAICAAQGFSIRLFRNQTIDMVDLDRSFLVREGEYIPVDFDKLIKDGDMSWNYRLRGGDYLFFANAGLKRVFVFGEVHTPISVEYLTDLTLVQAIAGAGGITDRASSRILVIRGSLVNPSWFYIDANLIFKGCVHDFSLMPNDIIYVPPMQFLTLRDLVRSGISSFVSMIANIAGTNTFLEVTPAAKSTGVISPIPVVGGTSVPTGVQNIPSSNP